MRTRFEFCLPSMGKAVRNGPDWLHEVKYDGYRMMLERDGKTVRLISRGGSDWSKRYPWIVQSALRNRRPRFVIDGEAVLLGVDGISDFNGLHSGKHDSEVQFYAFDMLALEGDDLRQQSLEQRKAKLNKLLARRPDGIFVAPFCAARSARICFRRPAAWDWKALCRSTRTAPIAQVAASIGSK